MYTKVRFKDLDDLTRKFASGELELFTNTATNNDSFVKLKTTEDVKRYLYRLYIKNSDEEI